MDKVVTKSRDLPLVDFYTILQQEYISYAIRSKIYAPQYAIKYLSFCQHKKEKIEKIAIKNALPSIFSSTKTKEKYFSHFFNDKGLPNFQYRDEKSVKMMGYWDKVYWFSQGTSIKVSFAGELITTKILVNYPKQDKVSVKIDGLTVDFEYNEISRIISENLTVLY